MEIFGATDARIFAVVVRQMMKAGSWVMEGWEPTSISLSQWPTFNSAVLNDESKWATDDHFFKLRANGQQVGVQHQPGKLLRITYSVKKIKV